jgi:acetyltransferase-like isoleucine patch superfamily enzyme
MKTRFFKFIANKIAAFYWAYLKHSIDNYLINLQKDKFLYFGKKVVFKGGGTFFHPENISIGDYVHIGENYFFMGIGGIEIGEGTILSRNICLHSGNHDFKSHDYIPYNSNYDKRKIIIGKAVWLGQNVNVLPGITIGDGAIIGMGVTVSKNVAKGEIIVGVGNRSLGFRDLKELDSLLEDRKYIAKYNPKI